MSAWKPLTFEMIEEGRLQEDFNAEFNKVQRALCAYVRKWGTLAGKAKAEINLKLKITCDNNVDMIFSVEDSMSTKLPGRPPRTTTAITDMDNGKECLFSKPSGTAAGEPLQERLCTEDGRLIDPDTGEVGEPEDEAEEESESEEAVDALIHQAARLVLHQGRCSPTFIQRRLDVSFKKASFLVDALEERGIVGPKDGKKYRRILISEDDYIKNNPKD